MSTLTEADKAIILKHSGVARRRARHEVLIVNQLIKSAADRGYTLRVAEFEDDEDAATMTVKDQIFDLDEATILVYDGTEQIGWVHLVLGNDGWDLISDFSSNLELFLTDCNDLAERLYDGLE